MAGSGSTCRDVRNRQSIAARTMNPFIPIQAATAAFASCALLEPCLRADGCPKLHFRARASDAEEPNKVLPSSGPSTEICNDGGAITHLFSMLRSHTVSLCRLSKMPPSSSLIRQSSCSESRVPACASTHLD